MRSLLILLSLLSLTASSASSIMGVDMGTSTFKTGLVSRGSPLSIVTNLHSKRKTEQTVLFDQGSRFFGADASSLEARKPLNCPSEFSQLLGRTMAHPSVASFLSKSFPVPLSTALNATTGSERIQLSLTPQSGSLYTTYTPEELLSMVFHHTRAITSAFTSDGKSVPDPLPKDAVITVPSFFTQHERLGMLTSAELAGMNVLSLIDENTASALNYGMDLLLPLNETQTVLFYNLGETSTQVTIVQYASYEVREGGKNKTVGSFQVLGKAWDSVLGGSNYDDVIVNRLVKEFDEQWHSAKPATKDDSITNYPRAMVKLRIQARKVKEVLSANLQIPIYIEGLHDDIDFKSKLNRDTFETMCKDLFERSSIPVTNALKSANVGIADVDAIELIGGGMRVPGVQKSLANLVGDKELGMHINSDESMALGAAFYGANISTAFRVRKVGMTDYNPWSIGLNVDEMDVVEEKGGLLGSLFNKDKKAADADDAAEDVKFHKTAQLYKDKSKLGAKKTTAFNHDKDITLDVFYEDSNDSLPAGTEKELVRYNITGISEFAKKWESKDLGLPKISLGWELSSSGIVRLTKAEVFVEETVEVEVKEEVKDEEGAAEEVAEEEDVDDDEEEDDDEEVEKAPETLTETETEASESADAADDEKKTDSAADDEKKEDTKAKKESKKTKPAKKEKKYVTVLKEQKKKHTETLKFVAYYTSKVQPYSDDEFALSSEKLAHLDREDKKRMALEEAKNQLEAFSYTVKNTFEEDAEELEKVSTEEQREAVLTLAASIEDWLYEDGYDADLPTFEAKLKDLQEPADAIFFRVTESTRRPKAVAMCKEKLGKIRELMTKWEEERPQVTPEEIADVLDKVEKVEKWLEDSLEEQDKLAASEPPAFRSAEVMPRLKSVETLMTRLSKKPKPKPVVNETETAAGNETETAEEAEPATAADGDETAGEGGNVNEGGEEVEGEEEVESEEKDEKENGEL